MVSKRFVIKRLLLLDSRAARGGDVRFRHSPTLAGRPRTRDRRATGLGGVRPSGSTRNWAWTALFGSSTDSSSWDAAHLDLGQSYQIRKGVPVTNILLHRLPVTLELALYGQLFGILFGIPLGVISAIKQDSATDHLTRIGALTGISIPIYWSGPLLILLFAQILDVFPPSGRIASEYSINLVTGLITVDTLLNGNFAAFKSAAMHLILPSLVIGIYSMALISRMMRSSMLEVVRQDYIRTARAKGQGTKITMLKHGFRNALIPVVTVIGIQFGTLLGGAVLTETVFGIPRYRYAARDAIEIGDFPVVQGTVLMFALLFTLVNLCVDITYSYLDPRIQQ